MIKWGDVELPGFDRPLRPVSAKRRRIFAAFLEGRIRFTQIPELIAEALARVPARALDGIDTCVDVDTRTRAVVREWLPGPAVAAAR